MAIANPSLNESSSWVAFFLVFSVPFLEYQLPDPLIGDGKDRDEAIIPEHEDTCWGYPDIGMITFSLGHIGKSQRQIVTYLKLGQSHSRCTDGATLGGFTSQANPFL
jgi:hypothetical protein